MSGITTMSDEDLLDKIIDLEEAVYLGQLDANGKIRLDKLKQEKVSRTLEWNLRAGGNIERSSYYRRNQ